MPGKVNPVIAESFLQVCAQIYGNCSTVELSAQTGNFELNVMLPVVAHNILESFEIMSKSAVNFSEKCITDLEATEQGLIAKLRTIQTYLNAHQEPLPEGSDEELWATATVFKY